LEKKDKAVLIGLTFIALGLLYWSVNASMNTKSIVVNHETDIISEIPEHSEESFAKAQESETEDPCSTPDGYTDEAWREHMGHHPGQYKDCL